jgi:NAD(P)-dependent dehydrogenase (short-subunit alcohol dehydrogenase family)
MNGFQEKVVLILGAGGGLGREVARAFSELGAVVAANDLNPLGLGETLSGLEPSRSVEYVYDIAKKMPLQALVEEVVSDWQRIDILINTSVVKPRAAVLDMDEWDWHRTLDYNLGGCFFAMQLVGRTMQAQGGGAIINVISPAQEDEKQTALAASQAGVAALTRFAGRELAPFGIRVNAVFLGAASTISSTIKCDPVAEDHLMQQWQGYPPAVAWVLQLASDQSQVFGQVFRVEEG